MKNYPYKILLADDHVLFREVIKESIQRIPGLEVVGGVNDGLELLDFLKTTVPNMIVLDITMPNLQGIEVAREIKRLYPTVKILVLTMHKSREHVFRAISAGADGYLLKENAYADLISAINTIREGKNYISSLISKQMADIIRWQTSGGGRGDNLEPLTPREMQVLKYIADGKTSKEIAGILAISTLTVYNHRINMKKKLRIKRNADLIKYALEQGYL